MPIRPENRARYPANWQEIRLAILDRASDPAEMGGGRPRCECRGECGLPHHHSKRDNGPRCRAPNHAVITWDGHYWRHAKDYEMEDGCAIGGGKISKVVLTIGHLDHQPEHNDPSNLRAWCQRCHNRYDQPHRKETQSRTRKEGKAVGDLFGG